MSDTYAGSDNLEVMLDAVNYNNYLRRLILEHRGSAGSALDFGAGIGTFTGAVDLAPANIHCVEPDSTARAKLTETGYQVYAGLEDLDDRQFDYIFTLNVLEHIEDDTAAVATLYRHLKVGGTLFIYVPALDHLRTSMDDLVGHYRRYSLRGLVSLLESQGFTVTEARYTDFLGYFATLLFRLLDLFKKEPDGTINRPLLITYDRVFFPISRLLSIPFGGLMGKNVYAVARKVSE